MSLAHCRTWRVQRQPETNSTQNRLCSQTASEASLPPSLAVAFPLPYIYIGHPGWKALGARTGYSIINGIFILAICLTGTMDAVLKIIPIEAGIGILLWIGIIIAAQAFQETPKHHALAVAMGLFPAFAAWGLYTPIPLQRPASPTGLDLAQQASLQCATQQ